MQEEIGWAGTKQLCDLSHLLRAALSPRHQNEDSSLSIQELLGLPVSLLVQKLKMTFLPPLQFITYYYQPVFFMEGRIKEERLRLHSDTL